MSKPISPRQHSLWNDSQAMKNRRPPSFGEGYAVFAAPKSIAAYLVKKRAEADRIAREIAWLDELRDLRDRQIVEGLWP